MREKGSKNCLAVPCCDRARPGRYSSLIVNGLKAPSNISSTPAPPTLFQSQIEIRSVPYFRDSQYRNLDIQRALEHFRDRYIRNAPIPADGFAGKSVADIGCGYGWLLMAYAAWTEAKVAAVEFDRPRLGAGRRIAAILGLGERIASHTGNVTEIPLSDRSAIILYCIEVLEHSQGDHRALLELRRLLTSTGC